MTFGPVPTCPNSVVFRVTGVELLMTVPPGTELNGAKKVRTELFTLWPKLLWWVKTLVSALNRTKPLVSLILLLHVTALVRCRALLLRNAPTALVSPLMGSPWDVDRSPVRTLLREWRDLKTKLLVLSLVVRLMVDVLRLSDRRVGFPRPHLMLP